MESRRALSVFPALLLTVISCGRQVSAPPAATDRLLVSGVAASRAADAVKRPILLFPGWGYRLTGRVVKDKAWGNYIGWLVADGYAREDIHVIDYPYQKSLEAIRDSVVPQLRRIIDEYPADTQFDVMGHSLGGFVALWTVMEGGFASRVKKYVSLSGIPRGWNSWYCRLGICGKADRQLTPFDNALVRAFHAKYAAQIDALEKCSIYSPSDEFVKPYDAGKLEGGTNVSVPRTKHMETIWKKTAYDAMRRYCYEESP